MRSVLDIADFERKGVPGVVFVEPSWHGQARLIGRSVHLPESRIQVLPLGKVTANSEDALALVQERLGEIIAGIEAALERYRVGRARARGTLEDYRSPEDAHRPL